MKVKININGVDTEIELTDAQVASIEAQFKPKQFEFEQFEFDYTDGGFMVDTCKVVYYSDWVYDLPINHGRYRLTQEVANRSLERNKRANRLEALAEQLGGLKVFEIGSYNYYIVRSNIWIYKNNTNLYHAEKVYMTEKCAQKICDMLNSGEFTL